MAGTEPHTWRAEQMDNITFFGLDVHKATVCVAVAESGRGGEVRQVGVFESRSEVLSRMVTRLGKNGRRLSFCYEAGPCGYGLQRLLTGAGHECVAVAPSLIPIKAGDRVKMDRARRDDAGVTAPGCAPSGFPIWHTRRCATWCGRGRPRSACWARRGSICKAFCCAMSGSIKGRAPGPWPTGAC